MKSFKIICAHIVAEIFYCFESTKEYCTKYLAEDSAHTDIVIKPLKENYDFIREYLKDESDEYVELVVISYMLSDALIEKGRVVIHGGAISYNGAGVIFSAKSRTGKTTHIRLWKDIFKDKVLYVNGDKPIIFTKDEKVFVSGSPFCGKEGYSENVSVPLKAICFIERGIENYIVRLSTGEALKMLINQLFIPKVGSELMKKALELTDIIIRNTEFYLLKCNMERDAPKIAQSMIFGSKKED